MAIENHGLWPYSVSVGDILRSRTGRLRVVRYARQGDRYTTHVCFAILHCSWTTRPYTSLIYVDLKYAGYVPTGKRLKLRGRIDRAIAKEIELSRSACELSLHCCDVHGVA